MSLHTKHWSRRSEAFTLVELLVAAAASVFLAGIIYTAGSEMLLAFARNISINRSYSDARLTLERIAETMESAGHTPALLNLDGLTAMSPIINPQTGAPYPAAGIRFYRMDSKPVFVIQTGLSSATTLVITVPSGANPPQVGDLISIPRIGFQGLVTAVAGVAPTLTLSFGGSTIASGCSPALTSSYVFVPTQTLASTDPTANPQLVYCPCLKFTQVEFMTVGTQLRYYPRAPTTSTALNTASNYKVIANLVASPSNANQLLPFCAGPSPTISITLCAQGPDYNNISNIHAANVYTQMQTCLGPRNPSLLLPPF